MNTSGEQGRILKWVCLIILIFSIPFPAFSQEVTQKPLTVTRAVETALTNHPGPDAAARTIQAAGHRYQQALSALYPSLSLAGSLLEGRTNYHHHDTASLGDVRGYRESSLYLEGRYTLFDGFYNRYLSKKAGQDLESEKNNADDVNRLLIEAVKLAFHNAILAKREIEINREDLTFQENMLQESRLKRKADLVAEPHVLNFLLGRNRARRNLMAKQREYAIDRTLLAQLMGMPDAAMDDGVRLEKIPKSFLQTIHLPPVAQCLSAARQKRPDLLSLTSQLTAAGYTMKAQKSQFLPNLSLVGRAGADDDKNDYHSYPDVSNGVYWYEIGLELSWDIYDAGSRRHGVLAAQADLNRIRLEAANMWLTIAGEVRTAHAGILKAMEQCAITRENIGIQKKQRALVTEQFRAGEVDLAFLNETQQELVSLEQELAQAEYGVITGLAALESAMGMLNNTDTTLKLHTLW